MCVQITKICYVRRPLTVYKLVRRTGSVKFISRFGLDLRWHQTYPHTDGLDTLGTVVTYTPGCTLIDHKGAGFYCYVKKPELSALEIGLSLLKCTVPTGVWIYRGKHYGGDSIITPILEVGQEVLS